MIPRNKKVASAIFLAFRLFRGGNWWYSKIPPLLSMAFAVFLVKLPSNQSAFAGIGSVLLSICAVAAFGHIINDIYDIDQDSQTGKSNLMAYHSAGRRVLFCILLALLGFIPWVVVDFGPSAALLLLINFALPMAYSIPPLRLKNRGVWGALADAAGVHAVPTLFIITALSRLAAVPKELTLQLTVSAGLWAFLTGLRGIAIHQLKDRENDAQAGINTLAINLPPGKVRNLASWVIFPAEVLALGFFIGTLFPFSPIALYTVAVYILFDVIKLKLIWRTPIDPAPIEPGMYILLHDLYEVWLPLALVVNLALRHPLFWLLLALHVALFFKDILVRMREVVLVLAGLARKGLVIAGNFKRSVWN